MSSESASGRSQRLAPSVWVAAAFVLAVHALTAHRYGYFGDELYYLACADHLSFGYVDHPPLSIAFLASWRALFGDSLLALRLPVVLAGALAVVLAGILARKLGGGRGAQLLAAAAMAFAPVSRVISDFYSMNAFDVIFWELAFLLLLDALRSAAPRSWLLLGLVLGFGLQNKLSLLWFGAGLGVGLLLTPQRRQLGSVWPWSAAALALAVASPFIAWQLRFDWPTLEFMGAASAEKMLPVGLLELFRQQVLAMGPLATPLWIGGLLWLLVRPAGRPFRVVGIVFLVVSAILVANATSRPNYLALAQPPLLAAGAVWLESAALRWHKRWLPPAGVALVIAGGLITLPVSVPLLSPDALLAYLRATGLEVPPSEHGPTADLPEHFANMHGWPELAAAVADVYRSLPPSERARAAVYSSDYSRASAVRFFARSEGVEHVVSGHNSYWLWGPGDASGDVVIALGVPAEELGRWYAQVEEAARFDCRYCRTWLRGPILIAREPKQPLGELWPKVRSYR